MFDILAIPINFNPNMFAIGNFVLSWHGFFSVVAMAVGVWMAGRAAKKEYLDKLEKAGVACLSGESFGKFGNGYVRFSFANSATNIELALDRIKTYLEKDA